MTWDIETTERLKKEPGTEALLLIHTPYFPRDAERIVECCKKSGRKHVLLMGTCDEMIAVYGEVCDEVDIVVLVMPGEITYEHERFLAYLQIAADGGYNLGAVCGMPMVFKTSAKHFVLISDHLISSDYCIKSFKHVE